jgi:hypothetical protein
MAVALTWWGWSGMVASVGAILALWARHAWRAAVRQELVDYLARAAPEIAILEARAGVLVYRCGTAPERRYRLGDFYRRLAGHPGGSAEAEASRLEVFAAAAITMRLHALGVAAIAPLAGDGLRRAS